VIEQRLARQIGIAADARQGPGLRNIESVVGRNTTEPVAPVNRKPLTSRDIRVAGSNRVHAPVDQLLRFTLDVEGELVVQVALRATRPDECPQAMRPPAAAHRAYANLITRSIAFDIRSQSRASTVS
jgi:hypothetical protein